MDIFDIGKDIFERMRSEGGDDGDGGGGRERSPRRMSARGKFAIAIGIVLVVILMTASSAVDLYTDFLWYRSHGISSVMIKRFVFEYGVGAAVGVAMFAFLALNWRYAVRSGTSEYIRATGVDSPPVIKPRTVTAIAAVLAFLNGLGASSDHVAVMKAINAVPFGQVDPIFSKDIGFYVFTLPVIDLAQGMIFETLFFALAGSIVIYLMCKTLRGTIRNITIAPGPRRHVAILAGLLVITYAAGMWLSRYQLLYSPTGIVFGMGYTDLYIELPAYTAMSAVCALIGVMICANAWRSLWKPTLGLAVASIVVGAIWLNVAPSLVQSYVVKPNEYEKERDFIAHHVESTRRAFSLDDVKIVQMTPAPEVSVADMKGEIDTVKNIRLWDYGPLLRTYKQLQEIRTYYDFRDIDIDRYDIDGTIRQVMISVRELDLGSLQNRTWVNSHLEFTHGYGVVMNPVNEIEGSGLPVFFMKDLPPRSSVPIAVDRPEIYFGEKAHDYALVRTNVREFDYPTGDSNARSTYSGSGGVEIGSLIRRLLFAIRFRDSEILFTDALTSESRVLFNRNIRQAIHEAAPFLILDDDAYPVIIGGRILWLQDAYTATDMYPYSLPLSRFSAVQAGLSSYAGANYLRNSVKITVDAYDGDMRFYITDASDPIVKCWSRIFPDLFSDLADAPSDLRAHFRYPEEFFEVQAEILRTYHMTDTNTFYNREDVWVTTPQGSDRRISPNYVTMRLSGGEEPEFTIITPFMPMGRNNLIGWMAARCDGDAYGQLMVYQFPKQELIYGPPQIEALIDQNTEISSQLSLWSQHGSDVIRGDLLVIPIGGSLLYVEPLYLRAERGDLPELKRIILSTGGRLAWGETFEEAAIRLFASPSTPQTRPTSSAQQTQPTQPTSQVPAARPQGDIIATDAASAARMAREHYDAAEAAARRGDWAEYGERIRRLGDAIRDIERFSGQTTQ